MRLLAPAKLNLHLRVGPPRADGFHPLLSWMCTVGLFDELEIEKSAANHLACDDPAIPTDSKNLILRAAELLGVTAAVRLTKRIPAGGGLAGGSSDAARALAAFNHLYNLGLTAPKLHELAQRLGSDVPFFLHGASSVCTGTGEAVRPIGKPAAKWALLILPPFPMPTADVYRRFDDMKLGRAANIQDTIDWRHWTQLPAQSLLPLLVNDLEAPAFDLNPDLEKLRRHWEERLWRPVRMSGSGSTLFTLFDEKHDAEAAESASFSGPAWLQRASSSRGALALTTLAAPLAPDFADDLRRPAAD
jgi:4-diphosphocytidyl-2-C-methyl-D-erythritol kinase